MAKLLQIAIIPHNVTSFKIIFVLYQFDCQKLPILKIDRGQIQFREIVSTETEPYSSKSFQSHDIVLICVSKNHLAIYIGIFVPKCKLLRYNMFCREFESIKKSDIVKRAIACCTWSRTVPSGQV